jgi:hypothetical protein
MSIASAKEIFREEAFYLFHKGFSKNNARRAQEISA